MSIKSPRLPSLWRSWVGASMVTWCDMQFQIIHFLEVGLSSMSNESPTPKRSESWNLKVDFRILDSSFQLICQVTELRDTKEMEPGCWTRPHISRLFRYRWRRVQISWSVYRFISFAVMTIFFNMLIQVDRSYNLYRGVACGPKCPSHRLVATQGGLPPDYHLASQGSFSWRPSGTCFSYCKHKIREYSI